MYEQTVKLADNQSLIKVDKETGEITELTKRLNNIPQHKELQKYNEFNKVNSKAIRFLESVLSNEELGIVFKMVQRANYETNVMIPLNDESSYRDLAQEFHINKNKVPILFKKLFDLGVYAQIKVANGLQSEYWTLNPYIAWKGKFIDRVISTYFNETIIAKAVI